MKLLPTSLSTAEALLKSGLPDRDRTCNPQLRRLVLYPIELRAVSRRHSESNSRELFGRGERIRTSDILLPKQARYRAALHPEILSAPGNPMDEKRAHFGEAKLYLGEGAGSIFA